MFHVNVKHIFILQNAHRIGPHHAFVSVLSSAIRERVSARIAVKLKTLCFNMILFIWFATSLGAFLATPTRNVLELFSSKFRHISDNGNEDTHCQVSQINNEKFRQQKRILQSCKITSNVCVKTYRVHWYTRKWHAVCSLSSNYYYMALVALLSNEFESCLRLPKLLFDFQGNLYVGEFIRHTRLRPDCSIDSTEVLKQPPENN